ncbi:hypothetical protein A2334_06070 [Candidatus Roizmanbacteria bacterium RIFOXYB2_FULL_38_10]|uniref:DUF488 domain-containing protein n=1 Tax=Candidatus Roizmanbacteria bacterium RIFOXYD1_FULL_38_12 TaxID=1802093 RepID=A0A1F7L1U0_9BACT|nr:MAG: hypothetical protein A3K47_05070 [Candidatus Roizmanbacteria bacterium RIFOXYA2_FULL_38_14]OGK64119.1 MAG: hypothetical protein A3K27_05070 [Candidatus Roizmanbacteria bacterium RIFOXYA1_FULL_37_12]OGK65965.1 MAG: hypothetical protein A3K38_05070 [Candidatus Roizmanbacteria bacterium RIFOXYB1_FULL_40_23]OGK68412.1 MAG: hypothetical protein A2334_06070 [Candidatus Roizmanbacteria bacterium RIFOXYB2_FULL_38_10]OGK70370.1 MAG: hypothetical protein A3K21_05075 [Candidatus Roizmanbacteria ba
MALFTKSIQAKLLKKDGIRICIMRRPDSWVKYDVWMPTLAPSHKLLDDAHAKIIDWNGYEKRFHKEVIVGKREYLKFLCEIAQKRDITILCWEKTPEHCHRRLVAEACQKINKKLKVLLK